MFAVVAATGQGPGQGEVQQFVVQQNSRIHFQFGRIGTNVEEAEPEQEQEEKEEQEEEEDDHEQEQYHIVRLTLG